MSCCGGKCGCGDKCSCGSGCTGCGMYPDMAEELTTTTKTLIMGVAPSNGHADGSEAGVTAGAKGDGCKCGANCKCDPCNC